MCKKQLVTMESYLGVVYQDCENLRSIHDHMMSWTKNKQGV